MWDYVAGVIGYYISLLPNVVSSLVLAILFAELIRILIRGSWI